MASLLSLVKGGIRWKKHVYTELINIHWYSGYVMSMEKKNYNWSQLSLTWVEASWDPQIWLPTVTLVFRYLTTCANRFTYPFHHHTTPPLERSGRQSSQQWIDRWPTRFAALRGARPWRVGFGDSLTRWRRNDVKQEHFRGAERNQIFWETNLRRLHRPEQLIHTSEGELEAGSV